MGRKFEIASKQTDSLRENAFINIGQKYELQLFCIIDRDRANGCQKIRRKTIIRVRSKRVSG